MIVSFDVSLRQKLLKQFVTVTTEYCQAYETAASFNHVLLMHA